MSKKTGYYRYRVAFVADGCPAKVSVGDVLIDTWHNKSHFYQFERDGVISAGFFARLVGEVTEPETLAQLRQGRS